jgi:hypothetical protein
VKLPDKDSGAPLVRDEVVFDGSSTTPPLGAVDLVQGYLRRAELVPKVRLRTVRRGVLLNDVHGRLIAELVDDCVSVLDGQRVLGGFRELEVETIDDTPPGLLKAPLFRLRPAGAGARDPTPKDLRAIGGPYMVSPETVLVALSRSASLGEVVTQAIASSVIRLLRHDPVVRLGTDPEGVHQARVATRRLRFDLRTFRTVIDQEWTAALRLELSWLGGEPGAARDVHVLLERLTARVGELSQASPEGVRRVIGGLSERRVQAHAGLLEVLRSDHSLDLIDQLSKRRKRPRWSKRKPVVAPPKRSHRSYAARGAHSISTSKRSRTSLTTRTCTGSGSSPSAADTPPRRPHRRLASESTNSPAPPANFRTCSANSTTRSLPSGGCATGPPTPTPVRADSPASSPPWKTPLHTKHAHGGSKSGSA